MYLKRETKKFYFKLIIGIYVLVAILNTYSNYILTLNSEKFKKLEERIAILNDEVTDLNFQVSKSASLNEIEKKANKLGFVKINDSNIVETEKLALKND
jgi:cell division protein FtsL